METQMANPNVWRIVNLIGRKHVSFWWFVFGGMGFELILITRNFVTFIIYYYHHFYSIYNY